jgi:hypothetical protein
MVMSTLWLFFFHIGFVVGVFLVSLIIGTLVIYLRKERSRTSMHKVWDAPPGAKQPIKPLGVIRHEPDGGSQDVAGQPAEEFEAIEVIFPLRQTAGTPRHVFTNSHSV